MQCDKKIINRLKRAEGQMRGIQKMMEEGQDCYDMMIQLSAVRSSIDKIMGIMAGENLKNCLEFPVEDEEKQTERVNQGMLMIERK